MKKIDVSSEQKKQSNSIRLIRPIYTVAVILVFLILRYNLFYKGITAIFNTEECSALTRISLFYIAGWLIPICVFVLVFHTGPFNKLVQTLGLSKRFLLGWAIACLTTLPMLIGFAFMSKSNLNPNMSGILVLRKAIFPGVMEEILYRGFLFGLLYKYARWGFIPAVSLNAVIFAGAHLYQSSDIGTGLGILTVTLLGGAWFAWLYIEWDTLWLPVGLHTLMNLWWDVFSIDTSALGGPFPNIFRVLTIALTIIITIRYRKRLGNFGINRADLFTRP